MASEMVVFTAMATSTVSWVNAAGADGVTWAGLMEGDGWTPERIFRLRQFAGAIAGLQGELPRDQFALLTGTSERSLCRWEPSKRELMVPGRSHRRNFATYAREHLNDEQRLQLLQT